MNISRADPELANLPPSTRGYLLSAALLGRFKPERLVALDETSLEITQFDAEQRRAGLSFVIGNSHPLDLDDPTRFSWTLDDDLRRRALERFGTLDRIRSALRTVTGTPSLDEPLWSYFEPAPTNEMSSLRTLSNRRQALVWLRPFLANDVPLLELDRQIERVALIAPLNRLAGEAFVGREVELQFLRKFVGVLPSFRPSVRPSFMSKLGELGTAVNTALGNVSDWDTPLRSDSDVVFITAPGGMGKSALLARLILQHWETETALRTPFAFLDFDRPSLLSRDVRVPIEEIGRQISIQCGIEVAVPWRKAEKTVSAGTRGGATLHADLVEASDADRAYFRKKQVQEYLAGLARALEASEFRMRPLLLVLDTLERVFRRGRHWIAALDEVIGMLRAAGIELRVIAGGRAFLGAQQANQTLASREIRWHERALRELGPEASQELLVRRGLSSDDARAIAEQVGGVPLNLQLAADYLRKAGGSAASLSSLTRSWLLRRRLDDTVIQGNLYQRILTHIEQQDVARLAYPGLIVREITPEVIVAVLAQPCGLGAVGEERALDLFNGLAQEFTLVDDVGNNRLRHRADVRQVMLTQMLRNDPDIARKISEAAVRYYEKYADPRNRAEELYHRLLLGQDQERIEERWMTGVEDYLGQEVIDEIPSVSLRVYTAARLELEVSDAQWLRHADAETWERKVAQDFDARLKLGQVHEALQLLDGRAEFTPGSPLYPLVAQAYADIGDFAAAAHWIDEALRRIDASADAAGRQTLVPLYLVRARIFAYIARRSGVSPDFMRSELNQLDALWYDHADDARLILIALLEFEVLVGMEPSGDELRQWLEAHVEMVRAGGGTLDPNVAVRLFPLLLVGSDDPRDDLARWLIDLPGARDALIALLSKGLDAADVSNGFSIGSLVAKLANTTQGASDYYRLRYLRVADHLQRMGLGWRVTLELLKRYPATELDMATRAPELRSAGADADRARFTRLFRAAKRISSRA